MPIYLIEYDRELGKLLSIESFDTSQRELASAERLTRELKLHRMRLKREVVILEAESEYALMKTHQRYFQDAKQLFESGQAKVNDLSPNRSTDQGHRR
jgi:hypothetical protein